MIAEREREREREKERERFEKCQDPLLLQGYDTINHKC
jgi:hypothetical protein